MNLCILVIHDDHYKDDILTAIQSIGVTDALSLESEDLQAQLNNEMSLFRGFFSSKADEASRDCIAFPIAKTEDAETLLKNLRMAQVPLDREDEKVLTLWVMPLSFSFP